MEDPLLTVSQLSKREAIPEWKIRDWLRKGGLPHYTISGIRIRLSEYYSWLSSKRRTTGSTPVMP
jgi:hypothetical protein